MIDPILVDSQKTPVSGVETLDGAHEFMGLALDLLQLRDCDAVSVTSLPSLGSSPRDQDVDENTIDDVSPHVDADWVQRALDFSKPDGRQYRLHEKRHRPPPQPILAPSVYTKELAPAYTQQQLAKCSPGFKGHSTKHDLVTFFSTGKPPPGPTLGEMAMKAKSLQSRLSEINDTNQALVGKVETLWRLRQSWGMTRPEINQWRSPLERPKVLREAPGRHFRTNILCHDVTVPEATAEEFEFTPGTLYRKCKQKVPIVGRWSIFKGEPSTEGDPPPEDFRSQEQIGQELRRHHRASRNTEEAAALEEPDVDVEQADKLMQTLMSVVTDIEMDITSMQRDLGTAGGEPEEEDSDLDAEKVDCATLSEDLAMLERRLQDGKTHKKVKGTGHIYLGNGVVKEVALHEDAMDGGGEDDDLEDRIKKPKLKRMNPHRDCFNPLSKNSVRILK